MGVGASVGAAVGAGSAAGVAVCGVEVEMLELPADEVGTAG
jgi:hypothetical protein